MSLPEPILVVGGYGYRNLGDEAILAGLLRMLGPDRSVTVVSRSPAETTALHGVPSVPIGGAVAALARHRTLLIGGGGLFGRDMGLIGRFLPAFAALAAAGGRTIAIHGVGIDPGLPTLTRHLLALTASRAMELSVRDRASQARLGVEPQRVTVRPDLSALVVAARPAQGRAVLRSVGLDPSHPIVGLALTALNPALVPPLMDNVIQAMDRLPAVQFCFIPMSQHPYRAVHNDLLLGRRLRELRPRLAVIEALQDPSLALAVFGSLDAAVCMRYHSILFAERAGTPMLPIPYAPKCDSWLAEHDVEPIEAGTDELVRRLQAALAGKMAA